MTDEPLRSALDGVIRRLQDDIDAQLTDLGARHRDELESVRRAAEAEAEQRWSTRVEDVRHEWMARLESEVGAARADVERRMIAESMRLRAEAEQQAAESAERARDALEQAVQAARAAFTQEASEERARAEEQWSAERRQLAEERETLERALEDVRQQVSRLKAEIQAAGAARAAVEAELEDERRDRRADARRQQEAAGEAQLTERQSRLVDTERLLSGVRALDGARSLSEVLTALLASAAAEAPRAALFVVHADGLKMWKAEGFGSGDVGSVAGEEGLLMSAIRSGEAVATTDGGPSAPQFAQLPADRAGIAVPVIVGSQPVAVLYADDAGERHAAAPAAWPETLQILSRHAAINLSYLTAARAAGAGRRPDASAAAAAPAVDTQSARRYARLLVSEIKLYNEPAVQVGRQHRDLLQRLKPEIDRARRLYEQRVSSSVDSRSALFHQELVQTLADGDPALLGGPA